MDIHISMHNNIFYSIIHSTSCENYNYLCICVLLSQDESLYKKYQQPLCKKISHYPLSKIDRHENITIFKPAKLSVNNDSVDRVATGSHVLKFSRLQHVSKRIQKQNIKINNIKLSLLTTTTHMILNVGACDKLTLLVTIVCVR